MILSRPERVSHPESARPSSASALGSDDKPDKPQSPSVP